MTKIETRSLFVALINKVTASPNIPFKILRQSRTKKSWLMRTKSQTTHIPIEIEMRNTKDKRVKWKLLGACAKLKTPNLWVLNPITHQEHMFHHRVINNQNLKITRLRTKGEMRECTTPVPLPVLTRRPPWRGLLAPHTSLLSRGKGEDRNKGDESATRVDFCSDQLIWMNNPCPQANELPMSTLPLHKPPSPELSQGCGVQSKECDLIDSPAHWLPRDRRPLGRGAANHQLKFWTSSFFIITYVFLIFRSPFSRLRVSSFRILCKKEHLILSLGNVHKSGSTWPYL